MMKYNMIFFLFFLLVNPGYADSLRSLPVYICEHIGNNEIKIDGILNEEVWKKAEPVELLLTASGEKPTYSTIVKMLWDNEYLYIAFHCEDPDIWGTFTKRDEPLYHEEVVEIFFDADNDPRTYIELQVNPLNTKWDGYILMLGFPDSYSFNGILGFNPARFISAVKIDGTLNKRDDRDNSWTVEIAFPFKDSDAPHIPPRDGDKWRINLYRIERFSGYTEYSAWSPTGENKFHRPNKFGIIVFSGR